MLGIVYRAIAAHLIRRAGLKQPAAQTGAGTLIQRFGYTSVLLPELEDEEWLATRKLAKIIGFSGCAMKSQMVPFGGHAV